MAALEPEAPTRAAMSDAFSVVEMSVEEPSSRSPFLAALTGHGTTSQTTNHVAAALAHKVVHDTRFVEVHIEQTNKAKALKHAQSSKATTGDAPAAGHEDAFSADFHMDADFSGHAVNNVIGGSLFDPGSPEFTIAETVIDNAISLLRRVAGERVDEPDALWHPKTGEDGDKHHAAHGHGHGIMEGLTGAVDALAGIGHGHGKERGADSLVGALVGEEDKERAAKLVTMLVTAAGKTLRDNPSPALNVCRAPCKIFGDIHGQFRDLLLFFVEFGCPSHRCGDIEYCEYVFNGDWVDRGAHQLECVLLLCALKVRYPRRIHLNRGNHESAEMNTSMSARGDRGFDADVRNKLGEFDGDRVFKVVCSEFFRWLPLATVIESAVLVVHGGIGDGKWTLGDLADIPYPLEEPRDHPLAWQLCWSDPDWRGDGEAARGVHESERGLDVKVFGPDVSRAFCHMNGLRCIVRSHEYVPQGVMIQHGGYLATVFSARDYDYHDDEDKGVQNDGAIISVTHDIGPDRDVIRLKAKIIGKSTIT